MEFTKISIENSMMKIVYYLELIDYSILGLYHLKEGLCLTFRRLNRHHD